MYEKSKYLLDRLLEVFEKYDKTNIPSEFSDTPLVDHIMYDTISIACYLSASDGVITENEAKIFNALFGVERTPSELSEMVTDGETVLDKIGTTFNLIAETEKELGIYRLRQSMIVPLIKFFESCSIDLLECSDQEKCLPEAYDEFFCKIESALTEIPE